MKLFVVGNISSGKSFLIEKLKNKFPNYDVLKIDDYRKAHCNGSLKSEKNIWDDFPKEISKHDDAIIELTGFGKVSENIVNILDNNSFLVIKVNTDVETCLERNKIKDFNKIPYPKEFNQPIEKTTKDIDRKLQNGLIEDIWQKAINIIEVSSDINVNELPLMQYHLLFKLKDILSKYVGSLFTFGSCGRGTMKNTSDVDLYFLTNVKKEEIFTKLKNEFDEVRLMANEFVIRDNGILVELYHICDIKEANLFYNTSLIKNPCKTILKDDFNILNQLIAFSKESFDKKKEINFTIERLNYYIESLPTLIKKGDEYKYYFHNNIIVHEYVRLKAFMNDVFDFSYLPLQAKQYLSDAEWNDIIYNFGEDQLKHYKTVKKMGLKLIEEVSSKYLS